MKFLLSTIHIVSIFAILACPLWCHTGTCCEGEACVVVGTAAKSKHETQQSCCTGCHAASNDTEEPESTLPENSPPTKPSNCQGICGGAVLSNGYKVLEVTAAFDFQTLGDFHLNRSVPGQSPAIRSVSLSALNYGRFLCHLHSSFQC